VQRDPNLSKYLDEDFVDQLTANHRAAYPAHEVRAALSGLSGR
jgi:hypothetical protein